MGDSKNRGYIDWSHLQQFSSLATADSPYLINSITLMKKIISSLLLATCLTTSVMAQKPAAPAATGPDLSALPDIVLNGFKEFKTSGYSAATQTWAKGSSLMLDPQTVQNLNNYFSQIGNTSGPFIGPEVIRVVKISADTEVVYAVAKYERQLVFLSFTCFKKADAWLVTSIDADKDPNKVLPTGILSGQ
jgi:hypothetical protein